MAVWAVGSLLEWHAPYVAALVAYLAAAGVRRPALAA
jgi:hypothetical protein